MNFSSLDFFVYSSHKTSTQSLLHILKVNNYKAAHCHIINDLHIGLKLDHPVQHEQFKQFLVDYKIQNNKKIKILSCVRNPKDRLISSFFQSFHNGEMYFKISKENETTITLKNADELTGICKELIKTKSLPRHMESLDDLSTIHNINILELLEKRKDYYYLDHDLFELYVLDFNRIIDKDNCLNYLNNILSIELKTFEMGNLSKNKSYYHKYKNVKNQIGKTLDSIIENQYHKFYFTAFETFNG